MTAKDLDDVMTVIASRAAALRDAGVLGRVTIGDVSFEVVDIAPPVQASETTTHPIDDAATYGGHLPVPPWKRDQQQPDDEIEE